MPELQEKKPKKKRHIEYGRHLEFLIKKIDKKDGLFFKGDQLDLPEMGRIMFLIR
jgi:hypothetical protein